MEEWEPVYTEGDTGVSKSFLSLLFKSNQYFFLFYSCVCLFSSDVWDIYSIEMDKETC